MYIPAAFAETDQSRLHDLIEQHSFGLLVSQIEGQPFASHLPFLLDRKAGPHGCLIGHMARANPHWRGAAGQKALAIFSGPHVYVSPTWYDSEQVVPTWNYVAVHVYGQFEVVDDTQRTREIVQQMVQLYEQGMPRPWTIDDTTTYMERMLAQIVGFRIAIERIEGKMKLNQNHPVERRRKVVEALRQRGGENALAIADLMQPMLEDTR